MKVELIGGPLDGVVIEVPPKTTLVTVDRRKSLYVGDKPCDDYRTYSIVFDNRRPLRALFVGW